MRRAALACVAVTVLAAAGATQALAATADAPETHRLTVGDSSDAWYQAAPADPCSAPVGCPPPAPASPYPAGTLRVGLVGGQETARAYLLPDLSLLPFDADVTSAQLRLPLSTDPQAGLVQPDTAGLRACLVVQPFPDAIEGDAATPPAVDCAHVAVPLTESPDHAAYVVDAAPFLRAWREGAPALGLALLPEASPPPGATWQVAFNGKRAPLPRASTSLAYTVGVAVPSPEPPAPARPQVGIAPALIPAALPPLPGPLPPAAPVGGGLPLTAAPLAPPAPAPVPAPPTAAAVLLSSPWYANRASVYFPLLLLAGAGLLGRSVLAPVPPAARRRRATLEAP